jgi:hypothetical protein
MRLSRTLLVGLAGVLGGCYSAVCTDIGCESNLTFDFDGEHLPSGDYRVVVETSNGNSICDLTVNEDNSSDFDCRGELDVEPSVRDVVIYDTPEAAALEITQDGDEVASAEAEPEYSDYFPNGEDCDDEPCQVAFVTAELAAP